MSLTQRPPVVLGSLRRELLPKAVFLDRDGTINVERADYVKRIEELVLLTGALDAIRDLSSFEIPILLVTNQSVIGRGIATPAQIAEIHEHLRAQVRRAGGRIDAVYLCPHRPEEGCACRKPKPGLLLAAAVDFQLDLSRCMFVGDSVTDLEAARAAGCRPVMVRTGLQAPALAQLAAVDGSVTLVDDLSAVVEWMRWCLSAGLNVCDSAPGLDAGMSHRG